MADIVEPEVVDYPEDNNEDTTPAPVEKAKPSFSAPGFDSQRDVLNTSHALANAIQQSDGFVPKAFIGKPGKILASVLTGNELGVGPMTSLRNIGVTDQGGLVISAALQLALARQAGHNISGTATATEAEVTGTHADTGDTITVKWDLVKAMRAGLIDSIADDGTPVSKTARGYATTWQKYPQKMLWHRAITELIGMLCPEVLVGGPLTTQTNDKMDLGDDE